MALIKGTKRLFTAMLLIGMLALFCPFAASIGSVHADSRPEAKKVKMIYIPKDTVNNYLYLDPHFKYKYKKCKSSNTSVAVVTKYREGWGNTPVVKIKKHGTAKVTIVAKKKGKKKYKKYTTQITAYRYTNPFETFMIGEKEYRSIFAKRSFYEDYYGDTMDGIVHIKAAKGWKLKSICYADFKTLDEGFVSNGDTMDGIDDGSIEVTMYHKASGLTVPFTYYVFQQDE